MKKKNLKYITGLTLIEILIGIVITSIMMAAMYTSYNVVNQSYSKVSEKAKISKASRDLVSMLMRDIRMAGFRYYAGTHEINKFVADSGCTAPVLLLPKVSYLAFDNGFIDEEDSHNPVVIRKNTLGEGSTTTGGPGEICCDQIQIVYEDFNQNDYLQPFKKYRITYFAESLDDGIDPNTGKKLNPRYAIYKKIQSWSQPRADQNDCESFPFSSLKKWVPSAAHPNDVCPECTANPVLVRDYIEDMEFIPFDENGRIIRNASGKYPAPELSDIRDRLYDIRGVDIRLTFRSKEDFFRKKIARTITGLSGRDATNNDRFLRDSVIVSVHTRNIGGESF